MLVHRDSVSSKAIEMRLLRVYVCAGMERVVFYRERGALPYDPFAYGVAIAVVEIPYLILQVKHCLSSLTIMLLSSLGAEYTRVLSSSGCHTQAQHSKHSSSQ